MTMKRVVLRRLKLTEAQVTKQCIDFLIAEGWRCIRLNSGLFQRPGGKVRVRIGEPGMPDYVCFLGDQYFFLEFKGANGRLRENQAKWIRQAVADRLNVTICAGLDELRDRLAGRITHDENFS